MIKLFNTLKIVCSKFEELNLDFVVIGGIALQIWGEPRVTSDLDFTVLTRFQNEEETVTKIVSEFPSRISNPHEFARINRIILCELDGVGIDIGLGGIDFEEEMFLRKVNVEIQPGIVIPVVTAEDLLVMKTFAGRDRDWADIRSILVRQKPNLDFSYIEEKLAPLLELAEVPERLDRLKAMDAELQFD